MKIIRLLYLCMLCGAFVLLYSSCGFFGEQKYVCDVDEVESVEIVKLDRYVDGEYRFEYTVLSQISNYEWFVSKLNELEHSVNWGDPYRLYVGNVVIKIDYHDGDFDLIHSDAQWFNRSGKKQDGFFFFDDYQFNQLISDYISDNAITEG